MVMNSNQTNLNQTKPNQDNPNNLDKDLKASELGTWLRQPQQSPNSIIGKRSVNDVFWFRR